MNQEGGGDRKSLMISISPMIPDQEFDQSENPVDAYKSEPHSCTAVRRNTRSAMRARASDGINSQAGGVLDSQALLRAWAAVS